MRLAIGVDFGKTRLRAALVNEAGRVLESSETPSSELASTDDVIVAIAGLVTPLFKVGQDVVGIGIGSTGVVDRDRGVIRTSGSLPFLREFPIVTAVRQQFDIPVFAVNDVCAAALGEANYGPYGPSSRVAFVSFGTGVGAALVRDGELDLGAHGTLGLLSGIHIFADGRSINAVCGGKGLASQLAAALGTDNLGLEIMLEDGDAYGLPPYKDAVFGAALLVSFVASLCDPHAVVAGGGLWFGSGRFRSDVREALRVARDSPSTGVNRPEPTDAVHRDESGVVGAAHLVFSATPA